MISVKSTIKRSTSLDPDQEKATQILTSPISEIRKISDILQIIKYKIWTKDVDIFTYNSVENYLIEKVC